MAGKKELFEAASADPRVAALAGDGRPAFLFDRSGTAILWANAAGTGYFGARDLAALLGRSFQPTAPFARRVVQLSGQLASGQQRTERIALPKGLLPQPVVCRAERVVVAGEKAVLLVIVDGTGQIDGAEAARRAALLITPFANPELLDAPAPQDMAVEEIGVPASESGPEMASTDMADVVAATPAEPVVELPQGEADAFDATPTDADDRDTVDAPASEHMAVEGTDVPASESDPEMAPTDTADVVAAIPAEPEAEHPQGEADAFDTLPTDADVHEAFDAPDQPAPPATEPEFGDIEPPILVDETAVPVAASGEAGEAPLGADHDTVDSSDAVDDRTNPTEQEPAGLSMDIGDRDEWATPDAEPEAAPFGDADEAFLNEHALEEASAADDLADLGRLDGLQLETDADADAIRQEPADFSDSEQPPVDDEPDAREAEPLPVEDEALEAASAAPADEISAGPTETGIEDTGVEETAGTEVEEMASEDSTAEAVPAYATDDGRDPDDADTGATTVNGASEPSDDLSGRDATFHGAPESSGFVPPTHGRSVRFVFELDPELVISFVSPELAEIVGPMAADIVDFSWSEVAGRLRLDPNGRVTTALGHRDTFTGLTVDWPVQDQPLRIPVSLAGMPVFGRDRSFRGYRGFGIAHSGAAFSADAVIGAATPAPQTRGTTDGPAVSTSDATEDLSSGHVPLSEPDAVSAATEPPNGSDGGSETISEGEAPAIVSDVEPEVIREESSPIEAPTPRDLVEDGLGSEWAAVPEDVAPDGPNSSTLSPNEGEPPPEITPDSPAPEDVPPAVPVPELPPAESPAGEPETPSEYPEEPQPEYPAPGPDTLPPAPDHAPDEVPQPLPEEAPVISPDDAPSTFPDEAPAGLPEEAPDLAPLDIPLDLPPEVSAWAYGAAQAAALAEQEHFARMGIAPTIGGVTDDVGTTISAGIADLSEAVIADTRLEDLLPEDEPATSSEDDGDLPESGAEPPAPFDDGDLPENAPPSQDDLMWREAPRGEVIASPIVARPIPKDETSLAADDRRMLSKPEREAFQKIAEALGARLDDGTGPNAFGALPLGALQIEDTVAASEEEPEDDVLTDMAVAPKPTARPVLPKLDACLLDKLPIPLAILKSGEAVMVNRAFLDLTGYDDLAQLTAAGGFAEAFAGSALPRDTSAPAIRRRDGVEVPVKARLHSMPFEDGIASLMVLQEVAETTGRTRAEQAEARVEELEAILDTATDGVLVLDGDGTILGANKSAEALFGAPRATMVGQPLVDLLAPESHRGALDYLDGLTRNGLSSVLNDGREVIGRVAQGGLVPLFMTIGRVSTQKFCAVLRDITQWKRAEEELTNAKRSAENASSQKSDFLAKISHEIRTPLNAIIGFSEVMMEERFGPVGNDRYKEYLRDIHMSGAHIMSLVNDLLDLSKIEAGKLDLSFEAVALNEVVRECVALMQPQANRERIIIRTSLSSTLPNVVADSRSLRQIVLNLLSNALKFNSAGGQVIVSTLYEETGEVAFRVRDTGPGMSEEDVMKALEPFRQLQTTRPGRGTGLGLPLTKALVEANRAAFRIDSAPGQGTLVQVTFPSTRVLAE